MPLDTPLESRTKNVGLTCKAPLCLLGAKAKGFCDTHHKRSIKAMEFDEPINMTPIRPWRAGCLVTRVRIPEKRVRAVTDYAEARGLRLDDAIVELALQHLQWRSGREREETRAVAWSTTDHDAMERM